MTIILKNKETLKIDDFYFRCCIGKKGLGKKKIEGDGKTPVGKFSLGNLSTILKSNASFPDNSLKCIQDAEKKIFINPRYPLIKLSIPTALDNLLVNSYITEPRALIGKMKKSSFETMDNFFLKRTNILFTRVISDIDTKLSSSFYDTSTIYIFTSIFVVIV